MPVGNSGAGQSRSDEAQVESAGGCDVAGVIKGLRVGAVQPRHLGGRAQEGTMSAQVCLRLVEGGTQSGSSKDVAERLLRGSRHARAGRGDEPCSTCVREVCKRVSDLVLVPARGLPFNENLVAPKRVREFIEDSAC